MKGDDILLFRVLIFKSGGKAWTDAWKDEKADHEKGAADAARNVGRHEGPVVPVEDKFWKFKIRINRVFANQRTRGPTIFGVTLSKHVSC